MLHCAAATTFWLSAALLAFTFLGYPLLIALLASSRKHTPSEEPRELPGVTAVVIACNESTRIVARVENLLASDYPAEKLHILAVSDGSTDDTVEKLRSLGARVISSSTENTDGTPAPPSVPSVSSAEKITCIPLATRSGKPVGLNAAIAACTSDIIVFADARQTFAADTIRRLASAFADPKVGAVSGELEIAPAETGTGRGVDAYWKLERFLRAKEAAWDSCIGCTGAVYAIRRELFTPLPEDTILDDVLIPMRIAEKGHRILHDPSARAFDPQQLEPGSETRRKTRTLAGNFQMLLRHPAWLFPWGHRLWWQLIAHKYLRLLTPALLVLALASSAVLVAQPFHRAALLLQIAFYLLATLGMVTRARNPLFAIPAGFVFLNVAVVRGLIHFLRGAGARWETKR